MVKKIDFNSYSTILFFALIVRLVAAIFSEGYGMHDDHFLIIEASSSWVDGFDYNNWLPWSSGNAGHPEGHSFTYVGLNYLFFVIFKFFGVTDPKTLMLFNRLIHGLFSLLIVHFGYKIAQKTVSQKSAVTVGWILALLWALPFLSVRNLVEVSCIPFILWGVYKIVAARKNTDFLWAGILLGMAVSYRYQVGVAAIGIAAYFYFRNEWKHFLLYCLGVVITFSITQGLVDYLIWGYPFAELSGYVIYNMNEGQEYMPNTNYFMYFYVLFGLFLIPLGILLAIGFFTNPKKQWAVIVPSVIMLFFHIWWPSLQLYWVLCVVAFFVIYGGLGKLRQLNSDWLLYLPAIFFILFHTFYPNRQERFVLSVFPLVLILGIKGIELLRKNASWEKTWKISIRMFWVLNIPLVILLSLMSSKLSRVDAMYSLDEYKTTQGKKVLLEATGDASITMLPKYYANDWTLFFINRENTDEPLYPEGTTVDFIFFFGEQDLTGRINQYREVYPGMKLVKKCQPSLIDKILFKLNPNNKNQYIEVWKTNERAI